MKLNLHIHRLVLDGAEWGTSTVAEFEAGLRDALERELRTHQARGWSPASGTITTSDRVKVVLGEPGGAGDMGQALGRAIHRRIRG